MIQSFVLPPKDRDAMIGRIAEFLRVVLPENKVRVGIERFSKHRSSAQNNYLWGIVYPILQRETGQEAEDWHEYFLGEWSGWETCSLFGKRRLKPKRRSSKLSKLDFMDYVAFVQKHCAERGIYIPDPGEITP